MAVKLISASSSLPVSLESAKSHLNVDSSDDDTLIEAMIKASADYAETFTGRALIDQAWDFYLDEFPSGGEAIRIPKPPLIEVLGVFVNEAAEPIDAAGYVVDNASELARISLPSGGSWPTITAQANAVRIRFRAGYINEDASPISGLIPSAITAAILLYLGDLYANRESIVTGTITTRTGVVEELLRPYRVHTGMA